MLVRASIAPVALFIAGAAALPKQIPIIQHAQSNKTVSPALFADLEELARVVDISYCVGLTGTGITKPFQCLSRCSDFPDFELVSTWNTGQLMSDSCGYVALAHGVNPRIIVAFRGTYSVANTVVDLSTKPQEYVPYPGDVDGSPDVPRCDNCTVHSGFLSSWNITSSTILSHVDAAKALRPDYKLVLVGHSLGGAVAALAGLEFVARGWDPTVTTFGEPRIGNAALMQYIDAQFNLSPDSACTTSRPHVDHSSSSSGDLQLRYRRVTHTDDPVPLLPLTEWGYRMHAGEIYISKPSLQPDIADLVLCQGDADEQCIGSQDSSLSPPPASSSSSSSSVSADQSQVDNVDDDHETTTRKGPLMLSRRSNKRGITVPSRYKLWQLFFAHRDYFWRLGLCVPGGDPWDWGRGKYEGYVEDEDEDEDDRLVAD